MGIPKEFKWLTPAFETYVPLDIDHFMAHTGEYIPNAQPIGPTTRANLLDSIGWETEELCCLKRALKNIADSARGELTISRYGGDKKHTFFAWSAQDRLYGRTPMLGIAPAAKMLFLRTAYSRVIAQFGTTGNIETYTWNSLVRNFPGANVTQYNRDREITNIARMLAFFKSK
jgi:hypothetical protein